jgi:hypothetical protein
VKTIFVILLSLSAASAAASPLVTAVVSTRAARVAVRHRFRAAPAPQPTPPKGQCCRECQTSGRPGYWKPDGSIWAECPCESNCPCKPKRAAAEPARVPAATALPPGAVIIRERVVRPLPSTKACENGTCPTK